MLLPHLKLPLSQQKVGTELEASEIKMKLEDLMVHDTHIGVHQIQSQLESFHMELQDFKKGKEAQSEMCSEVLCTKCKVEGHHKDQCLVYHDYVVVVGPNILNSEPSVVPSTIPSL